jgi:hypothetical protein
VLLHELQDPQVATVELRTLHCTSRDLMRGEMNISLKKLTQQPL